VTLLLPQGSQYVFNLAKAHVELLTQDIYFCCQILNVLDHKALIARGLAQTWTIAVAVAHAVAIASAVARAGTKAVAFADVRAGVVDETENVDLTGEIGDDLADFTGYAIKHGFRGFAQIEIETSQPSAWL
jgi:hypothetical protein